MYFVISVFPISMTSGVLPPASVASNFCRCVPQLWYCTVAVAPVELWNCALAAATIGAQFAAWASVWSQTVMRLGLGRAGDAARGDRKYERGESDEADGDELPSLH